MQIVHYLDTRETQEALTETLLYLDSVFRAHSIRYTLDCGTLIGAVRHKGFIPWDDDVDVSVPRPDYMRLLSHPDWFRHPYKLERPLSKQFPYPFAKLFNQKWRAQEPHFEDTLKEYLWIDIFPLDSVPEDDASAYQLLNLWHRDYIRAGRSMENIDRMTTGGMKTAKKLIKHAVFPAYRRLFPYRKLYQQIDERAQSIEFGTTSRVANLSWPVYYKKPIWVPLAEFDDLIDLEFENHQLKAISDWDGHLTAIYGDYMQLPPVGQRQTHGMKVWRDERY